MDEINMETLSVEGNIPTYTISSRFDSEKKEYIDKIEVQQNGTAIVGHITFCDDKAFHMRFDCYQSPEFWANASVSLWWNEGITANAIGRVHYIENHRLTVNPRAALVCAVDYNFKLDLITLSITCEHCDNFFVKATIRAGGVRKWTSEEEIAAVESPDTPEYI